MTMNIKEVWDYRLSTATVMIDRRSGTWVAQVFSKDNPDYDPGNTKSAARPLEEHDTGIAWEAGDEYDEEKLKACFDWFRSVRDKYALKNIEEIKLLVKKINENGDKLASLEAGLSPEARNAWLKSARMSDEMKEFFDGLAGAKAALKGIL